MTTQNQRQQDDFQDSGTSPKDSPDRKLRDASTSDPEPEGSRFDKERQDRDRSVYESQNQGQGPSNVGDQSRTR